MSFLQDVAGSLLGTARVEQNQQALSLEQQKIDLNRQILEQNKSQQSNNTVAIVIVVLVIVVISTFFYFMFIKK